MAVLAPRWELCSGAGRQIREIQRRRSASDLLAQEIGRESTFRPRYGPPLRAPALVPGRANGAFAPKIQAFFVGRSRSGYRQRPPSVRFLQRLAIISAPSQSGAVFLLRCRQVTTNRGRGHTWASTRCCWFCSLRSGRDLFSTGWISGGEPAVLGRTAGSPLIFFLSSSS